MIPCESKCSLTYVVLSGRSSRHIATTSAAKGGRNRKDTLVLAFAGDISGEDGDDGGVWTACGVKLALDDTDEMDLSVNCGELSDDDDDDDDDDDGEPMYLKYFSDALPLVITERYGFLVSS